MYCTSLTWQQCAITFMVHLWAPSFCVCGIHSHLWAWLNFVFVLQIHPGLFCYCQPTVILFWSFLLSHRLPHYLPAKSHIQRYVQLGGYFLQSIGHMTLKEQPSLIYQVHVLQNQGPAEINIMLLFGGQIGGWVGPEANDYNDQFNFNHFFPLLLLCYYRLWLILIFTHDQLPHFLPALSSIEGF